ncbi:helix-turn-helix domain-containing protein, partial [Geomesophilobacter sediminis]
TPDLQTIIETVEQICNLEAGELNAGGRDFRSGEARSLAAWAVLEMSNETLTDLGKKVGRDVSTLSSAVNRLLRRVKLDASLAEKLAGLKRALSEIETLQA